MPELASATTGSATNAAVAIVREALGAAGSTVLSLTATSVEPRNGGAIIGVEAELTGTERRTFYVDGSRAPAELWVHPDDPYLPGFAAATFPHALAIFLARLGITDTLDNVELVGYRPGRRGVIRAECEGRAVFVKVVPPHRVRGIVDQHSALRAAGLPVPGVVGWSPSGVIVLEPALGTALTSVVGDVDAASLVGEAVALRDRLASVQGLETTERVSVASRAEWYGARLGERMPRLADRLRPLVIFASAGDSSTHRVGIHGDLHSGQIFVDPESHRVTGLIDIDTVALGEPGIDAGAFIAHALASVELCRAQGDPHREVGYAQLARHASDVWLGTGAAHVESARRHTVGHLLAQAMQLAIAHDIEPSASRLVAAAERVADGSRHDEDALIPATTTAHPGTTA